jgi:hypothetical protein
VSGDTDFALLEPQLEGRTLQLPNSEPWVLKSTRSLDDGSPFLDVLIGPQWIGDIPPELARARSLDDGDFIGLVRAYQPFSLRGRGSFQPGDYYVWMAEAGALKLTLVFQLQVGPFLITIRIEMSWFVTLVNSEGEVVAILYYPDIEFRTPEEILSLVPLNGIPSKD